MKEEKLLEKLNKAFEYLPLSIANGQARRQIRERIKNYAEQQELTANYIDIVIDLYDRLEQKKTKVTEEFVEKWGEKFPACTQLDIKLIPKLLKQMLKEVGVEVVK